jgi:hypothetical protein
MRFKAIHLACAAALAAAPVAASASVLFSDDFNAAGSAANYTLAQTGQNQVTWAWDYSTMGIPSAPNTTDGSTLGVKFESNMTAGAAAGVTLHTLQDFTDSYIVKFDAWINANGPFPGGGAGSTEFLTAGVGGDGITTNRVGGTGVGGYTAVNGEGGSGMDYRLYKGTTLQLPSSGQYAAGTVDSPTASNSRNANDPYYAQFGNIDVAELPVQGANQPGGYQQQTGTLKPGAVGFAWREVELHVNPTGGTGGAAAVDWYIDGLLIGTLDAGVSAFPHEGKVTVGYADPFASLSDNAALSFGVIDNLVVVPEPATLGLLGIGAVGLLARRRRL